MDNKIISEKETVGGCSRCGCVGIHACLGAPIPPWTEEKIKEFETILEKYESE